MRRFRIQLTSKCRHEWLVLLASQRQLEFASIFDSDDMVSKPHCQGGRGDWSYVFDCKHDLLAVVDGLVDVVIDVSLHLDICPDVAGAKQPLLEVVGFL